MAINYLTFSASQFSLDGKNLQQQYAGSAPYPHIVLDNFLPPEIAERVLEKFPPPDSPVFKPRFFANQPGKYGSVDGHNLAHAPNFIQHVLFALNSYNMLYFLEELTGIKHLVADPYFIGGGLHQIVDSGRLTVHADFNYEKNIKLYRRINLLIYFNKDWRDEYGGQLELWDKEGKSCVQRIAPLFNRCVIFNIHKHHYHGHPQPLKLPPGMTRKSMAIYYYTRDPDPTDAEVHETIWPSGNPAI